MKFSVYNVKGWFKLKSPINRVLYLIITTSLNHVNFVTFIL